MPNANKMNLSYLLNYHYYTVAKHSHFNTCNKALTERHFESSDEVIPFTNDSFYLKTSYPGLLIGIGSVHEYGSDVGGDEEEGAEVKLGYTLDYVTGQPIIPGSTVKGVLRSAMKHHADYVAQVLDIDIKTVGRIEKAVFAEGSNKVVFFDAVPVIAGQNGCLLAMDSMTPHSSITENPKPLSMLRVIPNVVFLFRFGFMNWIDDDNNEYGVNKQKLMEAFKSIIVDLGIGAKTNVGYGVMTEVNPSPTTTKYLRYTDRAVTTPGIVAEQRREPTVPTCKTPGCNNTVSMKKNGEYNQYCGKCYNAYKNKNN